MLEIEKLFAGIKKAFADSPEIEQTTKDLIDLRDAFGTTNKDGSIPKSSKVLKSGLTACPAFMPTKPAIGMPCTLVSRLTGSITARLIQPWASAPIRLKAIFHGFAGWFRANIITSARATCTSTQHKPHGLKIIAACQTGRSASARSVRRSLTPFQILGKAIGRGPHHDKRRQFICSYRLGS